MRRREFITLIGGAAAWPLTTRAQQHTAGVRRIGVLMNYAADDQAAQTRLTAFLQQMQQLGWSEGRNLHSEISLGRWGYATHSESGGRIGRPRAGCHFGNG